MAFIKTDGTVVADQGEARGQERDYAGLLEQLAAADDKVRRWAARDLRQHANASPALLARLRLEHDLAVREVILTSLTRLGDTFAVAGLVDCLRSEDVALRNEAIEAMKALPLAVAPIMGTVARPGRRRAHPGHRRARIAA